MGLGKLNHGGRLGPLLLPLAAFYTSAAAAQDDGAAAAPAEEVSQRAAAVGALSNWTTTARSDTQRVVVHGAAGYDGASKTATFDNGAEARLGTRTAVRGGVTSGRDGALAGRVEGKVDALRQETSGVDLAVTAGYESRGFNEVPAAVGAVALGRRFGKLQVLANVGYARGLEASEQYANAGMAGVYQVAPRIQVGVDSRFRIDLERDADEPPGEREWELLAGPTVAVGVGSFVVLGGVGVAANQLREQPGLNTGALGYLGLGAAF